MVFFVSSSAVTRKKISLISELCLLNCCLKFEQMSRMVS